MEAYRARARVIRSKAPRSKLLRRALLGLCCAGISMTGLAMEAPYCGDEGVWIQILGSGGYELDDRGAASYVVWLDRRAVLLVDPGPGSAVRFGEAGGDFADLDAVVFTNVGADRTADFPGFVAGSAGRTRPLPVFGPDGNDVHPSASELVERLIGRQGAYPDLADYLTFRDPDGYRISVSDVPATGQRRWARFGTDDLNLAAIPVHHGDMPSVAWRAEVGRHAIVFTGNFSNRKDVMAEFAEGADALVIHLAIPEGARGTVRDLYVRPSQIGRIAQRADVRMVVLGYRTSRTLGRETQSRTALEEYYSGPLVFANELECWGL